MYRRLLLALGLFVTVGNGAFAAVTVNFSTNGLLYEENTQLNLRLGETGSMFVWIRTDIGQTVVGIEMDIFSDDVSVLEATSHVVVNPGGTRWGVEATSGDLGDLVRGSSAFSIPPFAGTGLTTAGEFLLHSEVQFQATGLGTTNLSFGFPGNGIADEDGDITPITGTAVVNVTAVPEPGSFAAIGLVGLAVGGVRRWRKRG
jgi:hypothetical protein